MAFQKSRQLLRNVSQNDSVMPDVSINAIPMSYVSSLCREKREKKKMFMIFFYFYVLLLLNTASLNLGERVDLNNWFK